MPILECLKVSKAYGGLLAVSDLSFAVEPGEVYAIVGPNGAGKTSLFDCISGVNPATSGIIKFTDREIQGLRAHQISRLGLARTFQTTVAFDSQTVLTNVLVGGAFGRDGENPTLSFRNQAQDDALDALARCWRVSGSCWRPRSRCGHRCCCSMSRSEASTRRSGHR